MLGRGSEIRSEKFVARVAFIPLILLLQEGIQSGNLSFSNNPKEALEKTSILWVTLDTPVDEEDRAKVDWVVDQVRAVLPLLQPRTVVLISSQVPISTTRLLEQEFESSGLLFAYSPEKWV